MPSVSVCVPVFNGETFLHMCLRSILSQSYTDIEVIIIDDGSSDNSIKIIKEYAENDNRVHFFLNTQNLGLVKNWNRCIELSKGRWIKFVFQDDIIEPDCIESLFIAGEESGCPLVTCDRHFIFDDVSPETIAEYQTFPTISMVKEGGGWISPESVFQAVRRFGYGNFVGEPTSTLLHRTTFESLGGFRSDLIQLCDLEFWLRVGVHFGIMYVPKVLAQFRVHYGATSAKNTANKTYRMDVIDPLIIARELAFGVEYEPLRKIGRSSNINFERLFLDQFMLQRCRIEQYDDKARFDRIEFQSRLEALNTVFPVSRLPSTERLRLFYRLLKTNAKRQFDRHVRWRFVSQGSNTAK